MKKDELEIKEMMKKTAYIEIHVKYNGRPYKNVIEYVESLLEELRKEEKESNNGIIEDYFNF